MPLLMDKKRQGEILDEIEEAEIETNLEFGFKRIKVKKSSHIDRDSHNNVMNGSKDPSTINHHESGPAQDDSKKSKMLGHSRELLQPLSIRETPMIIKNKMIRDKQRRRSSMASRGKRASSFANGYSALPHASVDSTEFYKHISADLPQPLRMRQLLAWAADRVTKKQHDRDLHALSIAKDIEKNVYSAIVNNQFNCSWYNRPKTEAEKKEEHPLNVLNREKLLEYQSKISQLKQELHEWDKLYADAKTSQLIGSSSNQTEKIISPEDLDLLKKFDISPDTAIKDLKPFMEQLPFQLASNYHYLYSKKQFLNVSKDWIDVWFKKVLASSEQSKDPPVEPLQLLKLLSQFPHPSS